MHSANKQTETIHWRGTQHPTPKSRRKTCIYLFHFFIIRLFRVCCWNSSDNCLRLHKSNSVESQYEAGYTKKLPKNFYSHNIRLKTSKCRDLPSSIEFTMSVNSPPQQNRQVSESWNIHGYTWATIVWNTWNVKGIKCPPNTHKQHTTHYPLRQAIQLLIKKLASKQAIKAMHAVCIKGFFWQENDY